MNNWIEVVREFPGLPSNEVFTSLKRSLQPILRESDSDECRCVSIHTNYPTDNAVVFALSVKADTENEAKAVAEHQCDQALSIVAASLALA